MCPRSGCVYECELSRKKTTLQRDAGDKGTCMCLRVCARALVSVCHQGGGMGFSGRTRSSMLVFVRGSQIPRRDGRRRGGSGGGGGEELLQGNAQKPGTLSP